MSHIRLFTLSLLLLATGAPRLHGQATRSPYTEGSVWFLSLIRVKPGRQDDYRNIQRAATKRFLDEEKREGLVLSYHFISAPAATPTSDRRACVPMRFACG